jgi:PadR family transcriptional regulator PadR
MSDFFDNWTVQVRKGLIELCVLNALAERERYGYELVKTLVDLPGLGLPKARCIRCSRGCDCRAL